MFYDAVDMKPGSMIAGFRLIELLGEGGMGKVYLAEQVSIKRKVALKILSDELVQKKESIRQFMKEVKTTASMEHPAIVTAIDAGDYRGVYYFAMSYVDGVDLETWLETKGRLPETQALKYVIRIAEALKYAWDKHQLLHRDIKPGNIMVDNHDDAFLLDMGIAQHLSETFKKREETEGSPYYMSPEQSYALPLNWSSDLYSLGATLYHMVVGVPPYDAEEVMDIVKMHSMEPFPEPSKRNPKAKIAPGTLKLIKKMMGKTLAERFDSWEEFIAAAKDLLKRFSDGKPPKGINSPEAVRKMKKRLLIAAIVAAVAVALSLTVFLMIKAGAERKAGTALKIAEDYQNQPDHNPEYALGLFKRALQASSSSLVNYEKLNRANAGIVKAEKDMVVEMKRRAEFKISLQKASALYNEANQSYNNPEAAIRKCRMAKEFTAGLKPGIEEEYRRLEQLNKKIDLLEKINITRQIKTTQDNLSSK